MSPIDDELGLSLDRLVRHYKVIETVEVPDMSKNYGWDGSAWHKLPMVWGYSDVYHEALSDINVSAGTNTLVGATVPAGEVWVVTSIIAYNTTSANSFLSIIIYNGVTNYNLTRKKDAVANVVEQWIGNVYLEEDDRVRIAFDGCTLNDDLYAFILGYKMKIAQ